MPQDNVALQDLPGRDKSDPAKGTSTSLADMGIFLTAKNTGFVSRVTCVSYLVR